METIYPGTFLLNILAYMTIFFFSECNTGKFETNGICQIIHGKFLKSITIFVRKSSNNEF